MSEAKFTKGPWKVNGDWMIIDSTGRLIAQFEPLNDELSNGNTKESFANAALIAAAPEMYDMLQKAANELLFMIRKASSDLIQSVTSTDESEPEYYDEQTVFDMIELLAKARGEQ